MELAGTELAADYIRYTDELEAAESLEEFAEIWNNWTDRMEDGSCMAVREVNMEERSIAELKADLDRIKKELDDIDKAMDKFADAVDTFARQVDEVGYAFDELAYWKLKKEEVN